VAVVGGHPDADDEFLSDLPADLTEDFQGEARAVLHAAAVGILADVLARGPELVDQVSGVRTDLDTVKAVGLARSAARPNDLTTRSMSACSMDFG
jgi:hypothetical protein